MVPASQGFPCNSKAAHAPCAVSLFGKAPTPGVPRNDDAESPRTWQSVVSTKYYRYLYNLWIMPKTVA